jgi:hypothetical protein
MKIAGPMRKGQRHPVFCDGCCTELTYTRPSKFLCPLCAARREAVRQAAFQKNKPLATQAQLAVKRAVANGDLAKLDGSIPCVDCGKPARNYDHRDYHKPLEVDPVCLSCNKQRGPAEPYATNPPPRPTESQISAVLVAAGFPPAPYLRGAA